MFSLPGAWLCLNQLSLIPPETLSVLSQMLSAIQNAQRGGKAHFHLHSEELQLSPDAACFAVLDSALKVTEDNLYYSGPSLSGHSHQRPPTLIWPQIYATTNVNAVSSPSHQRPPL